MMSGYHSSRDNPQNDGAIPRAEFPAAQGRPLFLEQSMRRKTSSIGKPLSWCGGEGGRRFAETNREMGRNDERNSTFSF